MKDEALRKAFYNSATSFGSIAKTYEAAKSIEDSVTLAATREFLAKQEIRQKSWPHKTNSYVAPGPRDTVKSTWPTSEVFGPSTEYPIRSHWHRHVHQIGLRSTS